MTTPETLPTTADGGFGKFIRSDRARLALLFVFVLLTRIPFLNAGYGGHVDAWRIANTARHIAETGDYVVSRFPGYPVQEIACSFIWKGGPVALNGASAIFSALSVLMFALILRGMGCRDYLIGALALAFAPVFYINSVTSKDYLWALAFTLGSFYAILKNRPAAAGICLGFAIGSRLTSGVIALPLCLILQGLNRNGKPLRKILIFAAASTVTAIVTFLPVIHKYGTDFFDFYEQLYPDWHTLLERATSEMWGMPGLVGLVIALAGIAWRRTSKPAVPAAFTCAPFHIFAWVCAVVIYLAVFLRLPHHSAYLIPLMPFALLLLARFTPRPAFQAFCALVIAGSFITVDLHGISAGPIFKDRQERFRITSNIRGFLSFTRDMPGKNVLVVGGWEPEITNISPAADHPGNTYVYLLTAQEVRDWLQAGATIYYASPTIRQFNYRVHGIDLAAWGAKDVRAIYEEKMRRGRGSK